MIWIYLLELVLGTWIFIRGQEKKKYFAVRLMAGYAIIYLVCQGTGFLISNYVSGYTKMVGTLKYIFDFCMVMLLFCHCFQLRWKEVLFFSTSGYALQNITHYIYVIIRTFTLDRYGVSEIWNDVTEYVCFITIYLLAYYLTRKSCHMENSGIENRSIIIIALITVFLAIVLSNQVPLGDPDCLIYYLYDIFSLLVVLFLQYGLVEKNELQKEKGMIEQMLSMKKEQQELARDTIALINLKCHDLKHQVLAFERHGVMDEKAVREIKNTIETYDSMIRTGNEALDIILTEKSLKCANNKITFTHLIDGKLFDFMEAGDLYAFFGNILDNAIEALMEEPEEDRHIYLKAVRKGNLVCVHVENECSKTPIFEDGLPVTTKQAEKGYHGFGTRSIRYIAEKYNGFTQMTLKDHLFVSDTFFASY